MPNKNTFSIKPINNLVSKYISIVKQDGGVIIDPFANDSVFKDLCDYTNDLDTKCDTTHHMDALDFLKQFNNESIDCVLFDPPYSPRLV